MESELRHLPSEEDGTHRQQVGMERKFDPTQERAIGGQDGIAWDRAGLCDHHHIGSRLTDNGQRCFWLYDADGPGLVAWEPRGARECERKGRTEVKDLLTIE